MRYRLRGWMKDGLVLVYRTPASSVARLVPDALDLATQNGDAFWNVAICQVEALRPWGLPPWGGFDCTMVIYGLNVSIRTFTGKNIEGFYPVRSDADPRYLWFLGTDALGFDVHRAAIEFHRKDHRLILAVDSLEDDRGHAYLSAYLERPACGMLESAQMFRYPGALLSPDRWLSRIHSTEMIHDSLFPWKAVHVREARWNLFRTLDQETAVLETACLIEPGEFTWRVGESIETVVEPAAVL